VRAGLRSLTRSSAPADQGALAGDDPELEGPFPHILLVPPLPSHASQIGLRPLQHGVAQRPLPPDHAVEIYPGEPAEVDPSRLASRRIRRASSRAAGP